METSSAPETPARSFRFSTIVLIALAALAALLVAASPAAATATDAACTMSTAGTEGNDGWHTSDVDVTLTATDPDGVDTVWIYVYDYTDGNWDLIYSAEYVGPVTLIGDGLYDIDCEVTDGPQNVQWFEVSDVFIDGTAPTDCFFEGAVPTSGWHQWTSNTLYLDGTDAMTPNWQLSFDHSLNGGVLKPNDDSVSIANDGTHTVSCTVRDQAGNTFTKDLSTKNDGTPPTCSATFDGTAGTGNWYSGDVTVTLTPADAMSGVDAATQTYLLNTDAETPYAAPFTVSAERQDHKVVCYVKDVAGNENYDWESTFYFSIDSTPPTDCTFSTGWFPHESGWYHTSDLGFNLAGEDALSGVEDWASGTFRYVINDGTSKAYSGNGNVKGEGVFDVDCYVKDRAGNEAGPFTETFKLDNTEPTCTPSYTGTLGANGWYTSLGDFVLTATDAASGIASLTYELDSTTAVAYTDNVPITTEGYHTFNVKCVDNAGRERWEYFSANIDATFPTCIFNFDGILADNGWYEAGGNFYLDARDDGSGWSKLMYSLDNATMKDWAWNSIRVDADGRHTVQCVVRDHAGNELNETHEINIDKTQPSCDGAFDGVLGLAGWYVTNGNVTVTGSDATSGLVSLTVSVDGATAAPYDAPVPLSEGKHTIRCNAKDEAGNTKTALKNVNVDTTAPAGCKVSPGAGPSGWVLKSTLVLSADDATSGTGVLTYTLDGGESKTYSAPLDVTDGEHHIQCSVTDAAGNAAGPFPLTVKVDASMPTCAITPTGDSKAAGWFTGPVSVALETSDSGSGVGTILYTLDGGSPLPYAEPLSVGDAGPHPVTCKVTDAAGNTVETEEEVNVDLDQPTCTGSYTGGTSSPGVYNTPVVVKIDAADNTSGIATVKYQVNGGAPQDYGEPFPLDDNGDYRITCIVTDNAGRTVTEDLETFSIQDNQVNVPGPGAGLLVLGLLGVAGVVRRRRG